MQSTSRRAGATATRRPRRQRYIAAVRFADGRRQQFSVDKANDHDDARRMIMEQLDDVVAAVIATDR